MSSTRAVVALRTVLAAVLLTALCQSTGASRLSYSPTTLSYPECTASTFRGAAAGIPHKHFSAPTAHLIGAEPLTVTTPTIVYGATIHISTINMSVCDSAHFTIALYSAKDYQSGVTNHFTPEATTADTVVYSTQGAGGRTQVLYVLFITPVTLHATAGLSYHLVAGFSNSALVISTNAEFLNPAAKVTAYDYAASSFTMPSFYVANLYSTKLAVDLVKCTFKPTSLAARPTACAASNTKVTTSALGGLEFVGLLGQSYQVHGMDDTVYNLISDRSVHVNSRFVFLSSGECLHDSNGQPLYTCWSHAGSYLQSVALQTAERDRLLVLAGAAAEGFSNVTLGGAQLSVSDEATGRGGKLAITFTSLRSITIANAGLWSIALENSDGFLNIVSLSVSNWARLVTSVQSHGLIGQTWRRDQRGEDVQQVEGRWDDYAAKTNDLFGCDVVYNSVFDF